MCKIDDGVDDNTRSSFYPGRVQELTARLLWYKVVEENVVEVCY